MDRVGQEMHRLRERLADADAERDKIRVRLAELDAERDKITYALEVLDRVSSDADSPISPASGPESAKPPVLVERTPTRTYVLRRPQRSAESVRDALERLKPGGTADYMLRALMHFRETGIPQEVEAIVERMREIGWRASVANPVESVRAALSRAVRDGLVRRAGYGRYELAGIEAEMQLVLGPMIPGPNAEHSEDETHAER